MPDKQVEDAQRKPCSICGAAKIPPQKAKDDAEKRTQWTGHAHALARGTLFFQKDK